MKSAIKRVTAEGADSNPSSKRTSIDQDQRVLVAVRSRPLVSNETGDRVAWRFTPTAIEELKDDGVTPAGTKPHSFDFVFGPEVSNEEVYQCQCKQIIASTVEGYNGTIFAYGQTSSGKTHTMRGNADKDPGISIRAFHDIFELIGKQRHVHWAVQVSYLEIYNENIVDLLQPHADLHANAFSETSSRRISDSQKTGSLTVPDAKDNSRSNSKRVRQSSSSDIQPGIERQATSQVSKGNKIRIVEDKMLGPIAKDATVKPVTSAQECLDIFQEGENRRSSGATAMNDNSSRSHTIFRITVESRTQAAEKLQDNMQGVANLFMLAQRELNADRASLYLVDRERNELYIQVGEIALRLPMSMGIAGACASAASTISVPDARQDPRFNSDVDEKTGYITKSMLCTPIKGADGGVMGVVQFVNKTRPSDACFNQSDEARVEILTQQIGPKIEAAQASTGTSRLSLLNLVDLAGSERVGKSTNTGVTFKEGAMINKSLLTLGSCIACLAEGKGSHVPYRDSKLTHLLSTSLGGNARTLVVCAISPASCNRNDTNSTLMFASRAKRIVNHCHQNLRRDDAELVKVYEGEIKKLKAELLRSATQAQFGSSPRVSGELSLAEIERATGHGVHQRRQSHNDALQTELDRLQKEQKRHREERQRWSAKKCEIQELQAEVKALRKGKELHQKERKQWTSQISELTRQLRRLDPYAAPDPSGAREHLLRSDPYEAPDASGAAGSRAYAGAQSRRSDPYESEEPSRAVGSRSTAEFRHHHDPYEAAFSGGEDRGHSNHNRQSSDGAAASSSKRQSSEERRAYRMSSNDPPDMYRYGSIEQSTLKIDPAEVAPLRMQDVEQEITKLLGQHPWTNADQRQWPASAREGRRADGGHEPRPDWAHMLVQSSLADVGRRLPASSSSRPADLGQTDRRADNSRRQPGTNHRQMPGSEHTHVASSAPADLGKAPGPAKAAAPSFSQREADRRSGRIPPRDIPWDWLVMKTSLSPQDVAR